MGKLAKNTAIYAIGDIIPKLLNLITFPVLTSTLSTGDFGIINYINSIEAFLTIVTFLGLKTFYLVHFYKVGSEEEQKKLLGNLTIAILGFNFVFTIIMLLVGQPLFKLIGSGDISFIPYIVIGILSNFFSIVSVLPSALYRVKENPLPLTIINTIKGFLIMVFTCVIVFYSPSALAVLLVKLSITFVFGIFFFIITCKNAIFKFDSRQLKQALLFSLPLVPGDVAYYLSTMSDRILIEKYLSLESLGIYSMAATLAGMLNIISYGAYKAFEPYFFKTYGLTGFRDNFQKVRDYLLYIMLSLGLCMIAYAKEVIYLFSTEGYHEAYLYVAPLVLGVILSTLSSLYTTILTAQSKTKLCALITIICALFSVCFNVFLLEKIGIWAAIFANVLIYFISWGLSKIISGLSVNFGKAFLSIVVFCVVGYLCVYVIKFDDILVSVGTKTIVVLLYVLVLGHLFSIMPVSVLKMVLKK